MYICWLELGHVINQIFITRYSSTKVNVSEECTCGCCWARGSVISILSWVTYAAYDMHNYNTYYMTRQELFFSLYFSDSTATI